MIIIMIIMYKSDWQILSLFIRPYYCCLRGVSWVNPPMNVS